MPKMHQNTFRGLAPPGPDGGARLMRFPRLPIAAIRGAYIFGGVGGGKG